MSTEHEDRAKALLPCNKCAAEHAEAEHYRNEAANVYLANEELQEQVGKLQAEVAALTEAAEEQKRDNRFLQLALNDAVATRAAALERGKTAGHESVKET